MSKRKRNKWERWFVRDHGIKVYNELRKLHPELKEDPSLFAVVGRMAKHLEDS